MKKPFQETLGKWRYLQKNPAFRKAPAVTLGRLVRWRVQCALKIPAIVKLDPWKVRLFLPPHWRGQGTTGIFALRDRYETELTYLETIVSQGMVVVDAGANYGIYTVVAARLVGPSGKVLSFEPGAQAFSVLRRNIELNQFHNVRAYRAALSDRNGRARLYHHEQGQTSFSLGAPKHARTGFEEVATRTLEDVLEEEGLNRIGLIKLDVEGAEELVLRGMERILAHSHPAIILEMNAFATEGLDLRRTGSWELLKGLGYEFFSLHGAGNPQAMDRPPEADEIRNVIALHRNKK